MSAHDINYAAIKLILHETQYDLTSLQEEYREARESWANCLLLVECERDMLLAKVEMLEAKLRKSEIQADDAIDAQRAASPWVR